ncbi:MAG: thioredoxin domain-containing protein [Gemmatimonadota bacterium]
MADRLKSATSPYLLQHAGNPVDWWPWCDEAFEAARARDVPVMLSVGYSSCHWCHVMAHESFEDERTAALMNEHLVSIKVDREERPDVDAVYMTATQAMTGQGGWPMTVFMTPDGEPFYCGTYFPREQFQRLVLGVANAWRQDRDSVTGQAGQIAAALAEQTGPLRAEPAGDLAAVCEQAVTALARAFDGERGGFGRAPKFPPSMVLEFLLRHSERAAPDGAGASGQRALEMAARTAAAMATGGMYDQLGGGFARYSVDAAWVVPHFEKMLYDNALLARVYLHLWRRTGDPLARRVASETCAWMIRELRTPEGGFASALDADSEGEEGRFYVWTPAELTAVLGAEDGAYAARVFGVTEQGTFEGGRSVLQWRSAAGGAAGGDAAAGAAPDGDAAGGDGERLARIRAALLAARAERVRPGRDDKVVAAWNGLAIAALAECGLLLGETAFIGAARDAATLLAREHLRDGRLARTSRNGVAGPGAGVLDDYACVADGLLALSGATGEGQWVPVAGELLAAALDRFGDGSGGFYDTADDSERLLYRPADPADGPTPSGAFAAAGALLGYAALTGSARHREAALAALGPLGPIAARYPRAAGSGLAVAEAMLAGPAEIAVVGPLGDPRTRALHVTALAAAPPGAVIAAGDAAPAGTGGAGPSAGTGDEAAGAGAAAGAGEGAGDGAVGAGPVPLLAHRTLVDGAPAAYVCRNFACRLPVTEPGQLRAELAYPGAAPAGLPG